MAMNRAIPATHSTARLRMAGIVVHGGFVATGVVTALLGPILPTLISRWSLSDERAGLLFTAQFGGSMAGVASSSLLLPGRGYRMALVLGYAAMTLGVAALGLGSWQVGLAATAVFGYGLGLVIPSSNLWVAEAEPSRRSSALSVLNMAWGLGAVACAPLVMLAQRNRNVEALLLSLAAAAGVSAVAVAATKLESRPGAHSQEVPPTDSRAPRRIALTLGALFFLYVGVENSVAGWAAANAKRTDATTGNFWALTPMFFWGALLGGRALAPAALRRLSESLLAYVGLAIAGAGTAALLVVTTLRGVVVGVAAAGLGLASIYPILVAWLAEYYGPGARRVSGVMFALAGLGGATLPWLVGAISTRVGNLRMGLLVPLAGCFAMMNLLLLFRGGRTSPAFRAQV